MSEIRKDLVKNNWVAVAEDRALKPNDFPIAKKGLDKTAAAGFCPFCEGNEEFTPPEITACRENDSAANTPGWLVRAIPNKFSAFNLQGVLEKTNDGIYTHYNGLGRHEVVIETPQHGVEFHELDLDRILLIIRVLKQRYNELANDERIKYIQIYKNRGLLAGASLEHSHSQIVGLPFVPHENDGMPEYYLEKGHCLLCDMMVQEQREQKRVIAQSEYFLLLCPYAPRFPYETWIVPIKHGEHFGNISEDEMQDLAKITKTFTTMIMDYLQAPSYNLVVNTAPINSKYKAGYHWYIEVTPRLLVNAAVEIATGIFLNPVASEMAAPILKEALMAAENNECYR